MLVLITCNHNECARVATTFLPLYVSEDFSRRPRAANSAVRGRIWPNFELIRDFMVVLVTCKKEGNQIINEGARMVTTLNIDVVNFHCDPIFGNCWHFKINKKLMVKYKQVYYAHQ